MKDIIKILDKYFSDNTHYRMRDLLEQDAQYNILMSVRNTGKSYQVKHYFVLDAILNNRRFVYMRRYGVEMRNVQVQSWFEDIDYEKINKICNTEYTCIRVYSSEMWLCTGDGAKVERALLIGRSVCLATSGHVKSNVFKDYYNLILEEFATDQGYLQHEPKKLMDTISTVFRDTIGKVFLLGNLMARYFPYIEEWGLKNLPSIKPNEIQIYNFENVKIAAQFCENTAEKRNIKSMFFGSAKKNIEGNEWITYEQPHLPFEYKDAENLYAVTLEHMNMRYRIRLIGYNGNMYCYVHPCKDYYKDTSFEYRIISKEVSVNPMHTTKLIEVCKGDRYLIDLIRKEKVFYSDNLTGTEFKNIIKEYM